MNIVIPFAGDAENLRYTLRSICKCIPHDSLYVIGSKPDWYTGNFILHKSATNEAYKARDILDKTLLSPVESFVRFSDDYIFTEPFDCTKFYTMGSLKELRDSKARGNTYRTIIENTMSVAGNLISLEQHCPVPMQRDVLKELRKKYDWSYPNGYLIRSLYGRLANVTSEYRTDIVLHRGLPGTQAMFSIGCYNYGADMYKWLNNQFPEPCKYEL